MGGIKTISQGTSLLSLVPGKICTLQAPLLEVKVPLEKEGSFRDTVSSYENIWRQQTNSAFTNKTNPESDGRAHRWASCIVQL